MMCKNNNEVTTKINVEQSWRNLGVLLDIDNSHGQVLEVEEFLSKLTNT